MDKINKSTINGFTDKVIISTSKEDKKIFLWDENNRSIIYTYEDNNIKTFIPNNKLLIVGQDLYSEYIIAMQENKSLITIWKTNASEPFLKSTPIDERIISTEISSNNKLLFIGTETGNLFIHELFSGNIIGLPISNEKIYSIKAVTNNSSFVICLCKDYIKFFFLENLLERNTEHVNEIPNTENLSNILTIGFTTTYIIMSSTNKLVIYTFPNLKLIKSFYIDDVIVSIQLDTNNLLSFYIICENRIFIIDINKLELISNSIPDPVIVTERKIKCSCVTNKYILTGHDEGLILIWEKNDKIFKHVNTFSQHKGSITNIISINRPISQYGLNFNSSIEDVIIKPLKKQNSNLTSEIHINKRNDYTSNFIESKIKENNEKFFDHKINNSDSIKTHNINDNIFLKRKLNELLNILNNK